MCSNTVNLTLQILGGWHLCNKFTTGQKSTLSTFLTCWKSTIQVSCKTDLLVLWEFLRKQAKLIEEKRKMTDWNIDKIQFYMNIHVIRFTNLADLWVKIKEKPVILCAHSMLRSCEQRMKCRSCSENMQKVCLFHSQNNKIVWLSNMADTFFEKFMRCAKVCGLFSYLDWALQMLIDSARKLWSHGSYCHCKLLSEPLTIHFILDPVVRGGKPELYDPTDTCRPTYDQQTAA